MFYAKPTNARFAAEVQGGRAVKRWVQRIGLGAASLALEGGSEGLVLGESVQKHGRGTLTPVACCLMPVPDYFDLLLPE